MEKGQGESPRPILLHSNLSQRPHHRHGDRGYSLAGLIAEILRTYALSVHCFLFNNEMEHRRALSEVIRNIG